MKSFYGIVSGIVVLALILSPMFGVNSFAINPNVPCGSLTCTVTFTEVGLPGGTSWTVNLNGLVKGNTTNSITFTGLSPGNEYYYYQVAAGPSGTQYAPSVGTGYNCCIDPGKQPSQDVVYVLQYSVTFAVSPSSCGNSYSCGSTSPIDRTSGFFNAGSVIAISAITATNPIVSTFSKWTSNTANIKIGNATLAATNATINGAGTLTSVFKAIKYTATFNQVGLPGTQTWAVTFGGSTSAPTSSSSISFKGKLASPYGWNIANPGEGTPTRYTPMVPSTTMYVPGQVVQQVQFLTQYQVSWATTGSGTIGFCYDLRQTSSCTSAGSPVYFNAQSTVQVTAYGTSSTVFSSWSASPAGNVVFGSSGSASTTATIKGPATITANFVPAFPCATTCTVTFTQTGLPAGQGWYVTWCLAYNQNCQVYTSSTSSISIPNVVGGATGTLYNYYVAGAGSVGLGGGPGVQYVPTPGCNYCLMTVGEASSSQTTQAFVYAKQDYLTVGVNPCCTGSLSFGTGWYNDGTNYTIWFSYGYPGYTFSSWSSSSASVTFVKTTSASTQMNVNGPATITGNLGIPKKTVTFQESGLPAGTIWGITFNGQWYFSTVATPNKVVIPNVGAFWYCVNFGTSNNGLTSPINGGAGIQYASGTSGSGAGGCMTVGGQTSQVVIFAKQVQIVLAVAPTPSAGGTNPGAGSVASSYCSSGASACSNTWWVNNATQFGVASTFAGFKFDAWSASTAKITFTSKTTNATVATVNGAGTITATFG